MTPYAQPARTVSVGQQTTRVLAGSNSTGNGLVSGSFSLLRGGQPMGKLGYQGQQLEFRAYCLPSTSPLFCISL